MATSVLGVWDFRKKSVTKYDHLPAEDSPTLITLIAFLLESRLSSFFWNHHSWLLGFFSPRLSSLLSSLAFHVEIILRSCTPGSLCSLLPNSLKSWGLRNLVRFLLLDLQATTHFKTMSWGNKFYWFRVGTVDLGWLSCYNMPFVILLSPFPPPLPNPHCDSLAREIH